jgi:hypothetical protein
MAKTLVESPISTIRRSYAVFKVQADRGDATIYTRNLKPGIQKKSSKEKLKLRKIQHFARLSEAQSSDKSAFRRYTPWGVALA